MSLTVFTLDLYDPLFVLEANFDGPPPPFWSQLEAKIGNELREMLRCCKPPQDRRGELFEAVTRPGSSTPVAPLLEALTVKPLVYHLGNRGLDRTRILLEGKLFRAVLSLLGSGASLRNIPPGEIHRDLRQKLLPQFPWLDQPAAPRIPFVENLHDWARLLGFAVLILAVLLLPGLLLALLVNPDRHGFIRSGVTWALAVAGVAVIALAVLAWLRWLERRDFLHDAPPVDEEAMRAMARREDFIAQNHMISMVHVKQGVLRSVVLKVAMRGLGYFIRVFARNGYLSSMRTIHFAQWALIANGGLLMFQSNYDGSWESYLDDFIEKAQQGLTLAWTNGIGFPPTRFLIREGAAHGRRFKVWARYSMKESQYWFSAYKLYSVNQIERQARIANGFRRPALSEEEGRSWAVDL
jgi:hypothetical protein